MQLVAYGAQDIYLTGNPQITFFKVVYRRHTNFSMEAIEQTWSGNEVADVGRCTSVISRNGDLLYRMYLEIKGTAAGATNNPMAHCIENIELEIGGQKIDKQSGLWMNTWSFLTQKNHTGICGEDGSTGGTLFQNISGMAGVLGAMGASSHFFVPLQFWFCRNPGLALPLIALQYHEVKVILNHNIGTHYTGSPSNRLWCDYIYLDTDERRRFAQVSHEYLIEQIQQQSVTVPSGNTTNSDLNFNHPVKELIFTHTDNKASDSDSSPIGSGNATIKLKLNGHERFAARDWRYFSRVQVWQHHTGNNGLMLHDTSGGVDAYFDASTEGLFHDHIGVYSFALKPEEHQPSGSCNFSRIDSAVLEQSAGVKINIVYAVNYNVLRIMSGMGGLAYSN